MRVVVAASSADAAVVAADRIASLVAAVPGAVLGLATGSSPLAVYRELARRVADGRLDLSGITAFALDEYIGLPAAHPQRYREVLRRVVAAPLGVDPSRILVPDVDSDPRAAGPEYEERIADAGGIDLQLLGIGRNGHIGFNEPPSGFRTRTRVVQLAETTRRDNARFFGRPEEVPTTAMTQGLATIGSARDILLIAGGVIKAPAISEMLTGARGPERPATVLRDHPSTTVLLDPEAASLLPAG